MHKGPVTSFNGPAFYNNDVSYQPKPIAADSIHHATYLSGSIIQGQGANPNDNRARKKSFSNIREFTGEIECDNINHNSDNNKEILPVLNIEPSELPHCESIDVDLETIDYGCVQEIYPVENHWAENSLITK